MENSEKPSKAIYSADLATKKIWYSSVANAYDRARPRYPARLVRRAVELAELPADALLLEIGCGPGTATTAFARLGYAMVCLEPSREACQLARRNCQAFPEVEVFNATFEEWAIGRDRFHAVLATTSFHWIASEIRHAKAAAALREGGSLVLLWNTPPQPSLQVYEPMREVYRKYAPSLERYEEIKDHEDNLDRFGKDAIASGYFQDLTYESTICHLTYCVDDYLALLSTLSPYIALDPQQRDALFAGLKEILEKNAGSSFPTSHLSALHVARKVPER